MIEFDCHAHVYETVTPVAEARYVPAAPAPVSKWLAHQTRHALKGGVIVQVSFLGADNAQLCAALSGLDRARFAGVAVVALDVSGETLDRLVAAGVRGVRWNLVRGRALPDLSSAKVQGFLDKLRQRQMHLEIQLEGPRLGPALARLTDQGIAIVVDHFGLPSEPDPGRDPLIAAVGALSDISALYVKFSGHYRVPFDVAGHAAALLARVGADHVVWGSDWPHTQHEAATDFASAHALCDRWGLTSDHAAARALYGIAVHHAPCP